jgi:nitroimidazol reductase NimA-like FMN-containing flavoprotein (pyridoxamine 5'-phosphate oxidase superfamily)
VTQLVPTPRTTGRRLRERYRSDTEDLFGILDEALHCTVSFVVDGQPRVIPTLHARIGDVLYVHGSTGSSLGTAGVEGVDVVVAVTVVDALVLARSAFHHSANYRSAVVHGRAVAVAGAEDKSRVLTAFVDRFSPGRSATLRASTPAELAATAILQIGLAEASVKVRAHGVVDDADDRQAPVWAGIVPLRITAGEPVADNLAAASYPPPDLPAHLT